MDLYNTKKLSDIKKLWNGKASDFIFINISDNERIEAQGAAGVQDTLTKLRKGHHSTANDRWTGSNMSTFWIRSKGGVLQASAHGPNALRQGETWAYFVKDRTWKISQVESIETRNIAKHLKIEIHEDQGKSRGFFDDAKHLIP